MNAPLPDQRSLRLRRLREQERTTKARILDLFPAEREAIGRWKQTLPVSLVLSGPRSGSSAFKAALARHPDCLALAGEHRPFFTLLGLNFPDGGPAEARDEDLAEEVRDDLIDMLLVSAFQGDPVVYPDPREALRYAWDWAYRLPLQWTGLDFDPDEIVAVVLAAVGDYRTSVDSSGDLDLLDRTVLRALAQRYPGIELCYYDGFPLERRHSGWSEARMVRFHPIVEITPFIVCRPRRLKRPDDEVSALLLKASSDSFRIRTLRSLFPGCTLSVLRLIRNPLAAINGLLDGWSHHCFWQHDLGSLLGEESPFSGWCFDLVEGWRDLARKGDLLDICTAQWIEPNLRIEAARNTAPAGERWSEFAFESFTRSPEHRARMLAAASTVIGLREAPGVAGRDAPSPVNMTRPHAPARWRQRADLLLPLLENRQLVQLATQLGYARENLDAWS